MLWVEQPVGTGFSTGKVHAHSEIGVAKDFVGFFKNWEKLFGIENYKIYITVSIAHKICPSTLVFQLTRYTGRGSHTQGGTSPISVLECSIRRTLRILMFRVLLSAHFEDDSIAYDE